MKDRLMSLVRPQDRTAFIVVAFLAVASVFMGPIRTLSLIGYLIGVILSSAMMRWDERARTRTYHMDDGSILELHCPRGQLPAQSDLVAFQFARDRGVIIVRGPWDDGDE